MAGQYLRGALVEFTETFPVPVPNVILFQYNPETMTHTWTPAKTGGVNNPDDTPSNPLSITGPPEEKFSFNLVMDAGDTIADGSPVTAGLAALNGVYPRLAALEMLLFPTAPKGGGLVGSVSSALGLSAKPAATAVPAAMLPTVFFVWGPGRIAPVRISTLTITEKIYDSLLLTPTHAEAQMELKVLTATELQCLGTGTLAKLAKAAASYTTGLREGLAIANLANAVDSSIGMLPV